MLLLIIYTVIILLIICLFVLYYIQKYNTTEKLIYEGGGNNLIKQFILQVANGNIGPRKSYLNQYILSIASDLMFNYNEERHDRVNLVVKEISGSKMESIDSGEIQIHEIFDESLLHELESFRIFCINYALDKKSNVDNINLYLKEYILLFSRCFVYKGIDPPQDCMLFNIRQLSIDQIKKLEGQEIINNYIKSYNENLWKDSISMSFKKDEVIQRILNYPNLLKYMTGGAYTLLNTCGFLVDVFEDESTGPAFEEDDINSCNETFEFNNDAIEAILNNIILDKISPISINKENLYSICSKYNISIEQNDEENINNISIEQIIYNICNEYYIPIIIDNYYILRDNIDAKNPAELYVDINELKDFSDLSFWEERSSDHEVIEQYLIYLLKNPVEFEQLTREQLTQKLAAKLILAEIRAKLKQLPAELVEQRAELAKLEAKLEAELAKQ